jgi:hypothetical protein
MRNGGRMRILKQFDSGDFIASAQLWGNEFTPDGA